MRFSFVIVKCIEWRKTRQVQYYWVPIKASLHYKLQCLKNVTVVMQMNVTEQLLMRTLAVKMLQTTRRMKGKYSYMHLRAIAFSFFFFFHTNSHTRSKQRQTQLELIIYALFSLCARCDVSISEELKAALKTCRSQRARSRHWEKSVKDLAHRGWYEKKPAGLLYLQLRKLANLALFIRLPPALCAFTSVCACTFIFARGDQVFLLRQNRARRGKCVLEVSYHQGHKPHAHRSVFLYQK